MSKYYKGIELNSSCLRARQLYYKFHATKAYITAYRFATGNFTSNPYRDWMFDSLIVAQAGFYFKLKEDRIMWSIDDRRTAFRGIHRWTK